MRKKFKSFLVIGMLMAFALVLTGCTPNLPASNIGMADQYGGFVIQKTITSSSITTAGTDITQTAIGDLYLDNLIIQSDVTGLRTGTTTQVYLSGGAYGTSTNILSTYTNNLTNYATVDLYSGSSLASSTQRVLMSNGQKLMIKCTGAVCTGSGTIKITAIFRKATSGAKLFD
jgi:hypothetical protein